jgi:hypothetical protein
MHRVSAIERPAGVAMPNYYEVCALCGLEIDFSGAAVVVDERLDQPNYQPFMEDWRGGFVKVAHPRCFAEAEGLDALLAAVARNDAIQRASRT